METNVMQIMAMPDFVNVKWIKSDSAKFIPKQNYDLMFRALALLQG